MNKDTFNKIIFTDEQINDELVDALIKAGAQEYIQNSTLEIPSEELSDLQFSQELDKKLLQYFDEADKEDKNQNVIKFITKAKNIAIRAAAALFVLLALTIGFVATSDAAQLKFLDIFVEYTDIDTRFYFGDDNDSDTSNPYIAPAESLELIYSYVPFGFELVHEDMNPAKQLARYESHEGKYIEIHQMKSGSINVDAEDVKSYMVEVDGVICYVTEHEELNTVICEKNKLYYLIISNVEVKEILKVISGINN